VSGLRRGTGVLLAALALLAALGAGVSRPAVAQAAGLGGGTAAAPAGAPAAARLSARTLSRHGRFRTGHTLQLGFGAGYHNGEVTGATLSELALGGVELGAGGFVTPWTAVLVRVSLSFSLPIDDFFDQVSIAALWGGSVQYFLADWLKLEAGLGLATHWVRTLERLDRTPDVGVGALAGVAVPFFQRDEHSLQLGVTYTPMLVREAPFHAVLVALSWQLL
jgi:hypothetical protein